MELTRFKRDLRYVGGDARGEALELLDAIDVVREKADENEQALARGCSLEEREIWSFVEESTDHLVRTMVLHMPSIGVTGLLQKFIEVVGYERIAGELQEWKQA